MGEPVSPPDESPDALSDVALAPRSVSAPQVGRGERWQMLRDLAGFQLKLVLDGLKDIVLGPLSLIVGAFGLLTKRGHPGRYLYRLMRWGRRYEDWIDLYGAAAPDADAPRLRGDGDERERLDIYLSRIERALVAESERGGLTGKTKLALDRVLDGLERRE